MWSPPLISISVTVALFVIQSGPALKAFLISHSSECLRLVKVPGGKGSVADERSSAKACVEETQRQIVIYLRTPFIFSPPWSEQLSLQANFRSGQRFRNGTVLFGVQ